MAQLMVHLKVKQVRRRMARHGYKFVKPLAEDTGLAYGNLRNAITCTGRRLNLVDAYTLAEALRSDGETVDDVVRDIVANGDGTPDTPPEKKTTDQPGPKRGKEGQRTGPKRAQGSAA